MKWAYISASAVWPQFTVSTAQNGGQGRGSATKISVKIEMSFVIFCVYPYFLRRKTFCVENKETKSQKQQKQTPYMLRGGRTEVDERLMNPLSCSGGICESSSIYWAHCLKIKHRLNTDKKREINHTCIWELQNKDPPKQLGWSQHTCKSQSGWKRKTSVIID